MRKKAVVICGPTASGKTELGHFIAKQLGGQVVNADSMQIYRQIPIITSSPSEVLSTELDYHLYNFIDIADEFSAVQYSKIAADKIRGITASGSLPIIVGGSGLYIRSLVLGYSLIPDISKDVRSYARDLYNNIGQEEFWRKLISRDEIALARLNQGDTQRIIRAFEVIEQTGRSIFSFLDNNHIPLPEFDFKILFLLPERSFLYKNCEIRTSAILNDAIEEISSIKNAIECSPLASKAVGIPEILDYLNNKIAYSELEAIINLHTRRYAKRQITWFKNQIQDKEIIEYKDSKELQEKMRNMSCKV
jgi:tRNA dimethylallyltransferase